MTSAKICGLTRASDVAAACELGARYVGFNFSSVSPRRVTVSEARELARETTAAVQRVGVFVHEPADDIRRACEEARLDLVQLHRPLVPEDFELPRPLVAWFGVDASGTIGGSPEELAARCAAHIVDAAVPGVAGGSGRTFAWSALASRALPRRVPLWLAGGLGPENVGEAIARVRPDVVDVASGVESSPGVKDRARLEAFFAAVRRADGAYAASA